jgi:hypothetical protein
MGAAQQVHDRQADKPYNANVAPMEAADPYEAGATIIVMRQLRDDPLARLHTRRQIDDAEYLAGRKWQSLYERAEIGRISSMDATRPFVDGGRGPSDGITDDRMRAAKELARLDRALGIEGCALIRDVLASHRFIDEAARRRGLETERDRSYLGRRFRECLGTLSIELGYREL